MARFALDVRAMKPEKPAHHLWDGRGLDMTHREDVILSACLQDDPLFVHFRARRNDNTSTIPCLPL
jgi:hypothetical protein